MVTRAYTPVNRRKEIIVIMAGKGAFLNIDNNGALMLFMDATLRGIKLLTGF